IEPVASGSRDRVRGQARCPDGGGIPVAILASLHRGISLSWNRGSGSASQPLSGPTDLSLPSTFRSLLDLCQSILGRGRYQILRLMIGSSRLRKLSAAKEL